MDNSTSVSMTLWIWTLLMLILSGGGCLWLWTQWRSEQERLQKNKTLLDQEKKGFEQKEKEYQSHYDRLKVSMEAQKHQDEQVHQEAHRQWQQKYDQLKQDHQQLEKELRNLEATLKKEFQDKQKKVAETALSLKEDLKALDQLSLMTERWHDQLKNIVANNSSLKFKNKEFSNIVKNVDLLALNANIEAARAGEAGRGFSVVADGVGLLSKNTSTLSSEYLKMLEMNNLITITTFQEIQASGNLIKTAMFSLRKANDELNEALLLNANEEGGPST